MNSSWVYKFRTNKFIEIIMITRKLSSAMRLHEPLMYQIIIKKKQIATFQIFKAIWWVRLDMKKFHNFSVS